jgi:hypothetical protein
MMLIPSKMGRRWRCKRSIDAGKRSQAERDAFGLQTKATNKNEMLAAQQPESKQEISS